MGARVPVGEPPGGFEVRTGSDTLREAAFEFFVGRVYLKMSVNVSSTPVFPEVLTSYYSPQWSQQMSPPTCRNFSRRQVGRRDAPWENEVALVD